MIRKGLMTSNGRYGRATFPVQDRQDNSSPDDRIRRPLFSAANVIKFIAAVTFLSGIFGVFHQKGMLSAMRFGNMTASYDAEEVMYSAVSGLGYLFAAFGYKPVIAELWKFFLAALLAASFFLMFGVWLLNNGEAVGKKLQTVKRHRFLSWTHYRDPKRPWLLYIPAAILSLPISALYVLLHAATIFLILFTFVVMLIPAVVGHTSGSLVVKEAMGSPPCVSSKDSSPTDGQRAQCTHLSIRGKLLRGRIMLQNKNGYFLRVNEGFIFVSLDGQTCIYSKDMKVDPRNPHEEYPEGQIDEFCAASNGG